MNWLLIQIIGFIGMGLIILSFQKDKRSFTLTSQLFASIFFAIHLIFLGAWTGAAMNIIAGVRAYVFNIRDSFQFLQRDIVMYVFILLIWIGGAVTWSGYVSLLPVYTLTLECIALWSKNQKVMRIVFLLARPGWISYHLFFGSYAGLATEAFVIASLVTAIIRFDILKKH